jgi:hypothetical protein
VAPRVGVGERCGRHRNSRGGARVARCQSRLGGIVPEPPPQARGDVAFFANTFAVVDRLSSLVLPLVLFVLLALAQPRLEVLHLARARPRRRLRRRETRLGVLERDALQEERRDFVGGEKRQQVAAHRRAARRRGDRICGGRVR